MRLDIKLFVSSFVITATAVTALMLAPFVEYNSSHCMVDRPAKMAAISFDERVVTAEIFGNDLTLETEKYIPKLKRLSPFLPGEIRIAAAVIGELSEYIGEAE